jgi:hypothetical protein
MSNRTFRVRSSASPCDDAVVPGGDHARQELLELERLRSRRPLGVRYEVGSDAQRHGSDLAWMPSAAPQHVGSERRHRRLPVGSGDADRPDQVVAGATEPLEGCIRECAARSVDDELWHADAG